MLYITKAESWNLTFYLPIFVIIELPQIKNVKLFNWREKHTMECWQWSAQIGHQKSKSLEL